jgi:hypothetical protein
MSVVTDVVFITPKYVKLGEAQKRFQELFRTCYTRYADSGGFVPEPVEDMGTKVSGTCVFHLGVNYMDYELLEALRIGPWPRGTVLYIDEEDSDHPEVHTW